MSASKKPVPAAAAKPAVPAAPATAAPTARKAVSPGPIKTQKGGVGKSVPPKPATSATSGTKASSSGRRTSTGKSSKSPKKAGSGPAPPVPTNPPVPDNTKYWKRWSENKKKYFYVNIVSKTSAWSLPAGGVVVPDSVKAGAKPSTTPTPAKSTPAASKPTVVATTTPATKAPATVKPVTPATPAAPSSKPSSSSSSKPSTQSTASKATAPAPAPTPKAAAPVPKIVATPAAAPAGAPTTATPTPAKPPTPAPAPASAPAPVKAPSPKPSPKPSSGKKVSPSKSAAAATSTASGKKNSPSKPDKDKALPALPAVAITAAPTSPPQPGSKTGTPNGSLRGFPGGEVPVGASTSLRGSLRGSTRTNPRARKSVLGLFAGPPGAPAPPSSSASVGGGSTREVRSSSGGATSLSDMTVRKFGSLKAPGEAERTISKSPRKFGSLSGPPGTMSEQISNSFAELFKGNGYGDDSDKAGDATPTDYRGLPLHVSLGMAAKRKTIRKKLRKMDTSAIAPLDGGVIAYPSSIDFGTIKQGATYAFQLLIAMRAGSKAASSIEVVMCIDSNITVRKVTRGVKALIKVDVVLYAESDAKLVDELLLVSEKQFLPIPITANIVDPSRYDKVKQAERTRAQVKGKALTAGNVRLVSTKAPTNPLRKQEVLHIEFPPSLDPAARSADEAFEKEFLDIIGEEQLVLPALNKKVKAEAAKAKWNSADMSWDGIDSDEEDPFAGSDFDTDEEDETPIPIDTALAAAKLTANGSLRSSVSSASSSSVTIGKGKGKGTLGRSLGSIVKEAEIRRTLAQAIDPADFTDTASEMSSEDSSAALDSSFFLNAADKDGMRTLAKSHVKSWGVSNAKVLETCLGSQSGLLRGSSPFLSIVPSASSAK